MASLLSSIPFLDLIDSCIVLAAEVVAIIYLREEAHSAFWFMLLLTIMPPVTAIVGGIAACTPCKWDDLVISIGTAVMMNVCFAYFCSGAVIDPPERGRPFVRLHLLGDGGDLPRAHVVLPALPDSVAVQGAVRWRRRRGRPDAFGHRHAEHVSARETRGGAQLAAHLSVRETRAGAQTDDHGARAGWTEYRINLSLIATLENHSPRASARGSPPCAA